MEAPRLSKWFLSVILFYFQHTTAINQISIDQGGDYVASCSDDGRVSTSKIIIMFFSVCIINFDEMSSWEDNNNNIPENIHTPPTMERLLA